MAYQHLRCDRNESTGRNQNRNNKPLSLEKNTRQTLYHLIRYLPSVAVPSVLGLVAVAIYTRILSPDEYGIYILIFTTALFLEVFTLNWLNQSVLRYYERYRMGDITAFFTTSLVFFGGISLAVAFVLYFSLHGSGNWFDRRLGEVIIYLPLVYVFQSGFKFVLVFLRATRESVRYSVHLSVNAVVKLAAGLAFTAVIIFGVGLILGHSGLDWRENISRLSQRVFQFQKISQGGGAGKIPVTTLPDDIVQGSTTQGVEERVLRLKGSRRIRSRQKRSRLNLLR